MKKFWRGFRKESDRREQHYRTKIRNERVELLKHLLEVGGHEAEPEYVEALKDWKPDISKEELAAMIRQFHDAVSERQSRDRGSA
jgi:threonyl-tRNA synthetase